MFGIGTPPQGSPRADESLATLRRPPSYSDSFFVLHNSGSINGDEQEGNALLRQLLHHMQGRQQEQLPVAPRAYLFLIKSAIHIFLVSVFETVFFFQYVSKREDNGVLDTINTYYRPLVDTCPSWSNETKTVVTLLLKDINYNLIERDGSAAQLQRQSTNQGLLGDSLVASAVCFVCMLGGFLVLKRKKIPVRWWVIGLENVSMVVLLGIYEFLFFHYVIYTYSTISTPELNSYIVQGLASCVALQHVALQQVA